MKYQIESKETGVILGIYEATTADGAIEAMARDAGYESRSEMDSVTGVSGHSELTVTEV